MKTMRWVAALAMFAVLGLFGQSAMAQDAQPKEEPKEQPKEEPKAEDEGFGAQFEKMVKGLEDVTGKTEATDADVKLFLKHYEAFDKLTEADEKFQEIKDKSFKEGYEYLVKNEKVIAWCKEQGLETEKWLKTFLRVLTTYMKEKLPETFKDSEKQLEDARKMIEGAKEELGEEEYKNQIKSLDDAKKEIDRLLKALKSIPGPTEAESKLLKDNAKELAKVLPMGGGEDGEDGEDGEGKDGMDG